MHSLLPIKQGTWRATLREAQPADQVCQAIKSMQSNKPGNPFPPPGQRQGPSVPGWCTHYLILFLQTRSSSPESKAVSVLLHFLGNCSIATRVVILLYEPFLATKFLAIHVPQLPHSRHPTAPCSPHGNADRTTGWHTNVHMAPSPLSREQLPCQPRWWLVGRRRKTHCL